MSISLKRARAIFVKDYKEFSRNYAVSIMLIFPIVLALLLRDVGSNLPGVFALILNLSFVLIPCFAQACLIAEEKEHNTLRSLMMTPATTMDVLIGKSTLVFVMSVVVLTAATYLIGYEPVHLGAFVAAIILSIILYTAAGTMCGLFSKTVLEASLSILPVAIVFSGASGGALLVDDYPILKVLEYAPSSQLVYFLEIKSTSLTTGALLKPLLIILAWTDDISLTSAFSLASLCVYTRCG